MANRQLVYVPFKLSAASTGERTPIIEQLDFAFWASLLLVVLTKAKWEGGPYDRWLSQILQQD
jgi:hypothetical protein